ncbi:MAG: iron-containing alcohol dehydrogenase, partial [Oscillospiraceae bacterium]
MNNFTFFAPTKVVFGKNSEEEVGALVREQGAKKVLIHFGGQSAKKSGLLCRVTESLEKAGISVVTLGGVQPNPRLS